jgi:hypothetical protein
MSHQIERKNLKRSAITSISSDVLGILGGTFCVLPIFITLIVLPAVFFNSCPSMATWNIVAFSLFIVGLLTTMAQKVVQTLTTISTFFFDSEDCHSCGLCMSKFGKVIFHVLFTTFSYLILISWDLYGISLLITKNVSCTATGGGLFLYILTLITVVVDIISNTCSVISTIYVVIDCGFVFFNMVGQLE